MIPIVVMTGPTAVPSKIFQAVNGNNAAML
jgi:hypothetical protein